MVVVAFPSASCELFPPEPSVLGIASELFMSLPKLGPPVVLSRLIGSVRGCVFVSVYHPRHVSALEWRTSSK